MDQRLFPCYLQYNEFPCISLGQGYTHTGCMVASRCAIFLRWSEPESVGKNQGRSYENMERGADSRESHSDIPA